VKKKHQRNGVNHKKQKTELRDERRKPFEKNPVFADFWPQIVQISKFESRFFSGGGKIWAFCL
jgi:hypothetical protein